LGDYEYAIDGINFQTSNTFSGLSNGNYQVTVRDKKECGQDTEQIYLLNYPKFFTPNGDGNNDEWRIKFSQYEPNFEVRIFDRYGKLLKIMNNNEAWDGKNNGRQMPSDDYWFYVIRNDGRIHKGHFAMIR
jgi:gliding motility-associated-like protein